MSICLPCEDTSVPAARRLVRETLAAWDVPVLVDVVDRTELIVSELASNAVRHARHGVFRLTVHRLAGGCVRVEVIDKSRSLPVTRSSTPDDEQGRGLALVDAMAQQWGAEPLPWGKRVWAEVGPDEPRDETDSAPVAYPFATTTAQAIYLLTVAAVAAWIGVLIARSPR